AVLGLTGRHAERFQHGFTRWKGFAKRVRETVADALRDLATPPYGERPKMFPGASWGSRDDIPPGPDMQKPRSPGTAAIGAWLPPGGELLVARGHHQRHRRDVVGRRIRIGVGVVLVRRLDVIAHPG